MTNTNHTRHLPLAIILAVLAALTMLAGASIAHANTPPVKFIPISTIGNGFQFPESVAVNNDPTSPTYGNIYVADRGNHRVQELTASGAFVSMFGGQVNETKTEAINAKGGTPTQAETEEENVCTAASKDTCQAGTRGLAPGQFGETLHIAIDSSSGNLFTVERDSGEDGSGKLIFGGRLQEFTAEGRFVLEAGQEVNANTKGDTCTHEEMEKDGVQCTGPTLHPPGFLGAGVAEPGALVSPESVAVGGPEGLVYVGEEHRLQEFETDGKYKREISVTAISPGEGSQVKALAVNETGDVYLDYRSGGANVEGENTIREFDSAGQQIAGFPLSARSPDARYLLIEALSVSPSGRLAVSEVEDVNTGSTAASFELRFFGSLLEDGNGRLVTEFSEPRLHAAPASVTGSAFGPGEELYLAKQGEGEVAVYRPVPVAELTTDATVCSPGVEDGSDATFACTLAGEVNPEGVAGTEAFFELGHTSAFGEMTAKQSVASAGPVSAGVQGLVPDETYYDRLAGEDENSKAPESPLTGERVSFVTPIVAPKILGTPSVSFLTPFSAVFSGELNPENTNTAYEFQYGTCENLDACPGALSTRTLESSAYGQTTAILEARELEPATVYHYRLLASNQHLVAGRPEGGVATGTVGTFTTGPAPVPQASSGPASAAGTTSATITGSVNPDGQPAVYTFEAGLYEGAATQYGVVFTATVDAATTAVPESVGLSGLQPGATYAYRIKITSGYGTAYGETLTFTTQGLPVVLSAPTTPALLAVPAIAFPIPAAAKHATPKHTTRKKRSRRPRKRHAKRKGGR